MLSTLFCIVLNYLYLRVIKVSEAIKAEILKQLLKHN